MTIRELKQWLDQFPQETEVAILRTLETLHGGRKYTSVFEDAFSGKLDFDCEFTEYSKTLLLGKEEY